MSALITHRTVPLPDPRVTTAVLVAAPDPVMEPEAGAEDADVEGAMEEVEETSGPMENGDETANSLVMLLISVARRV